MEFEEFFAGADDDGRRLDRIVRRLLQGGTLSEIYSAIRKGLVRLDGRNAMPCARVKKGAKISVAEPLLSGRKPCKMDDARMPQEAGPPYPAAFQNEHLLIVNKPSGVSVHGGGHSQAMDRRIAAYYRATHGSDNSLSFTPGPLHRLDRGTSGLLAFSWSILGARWFSRAVSERSIRKSYLGIACGKIERQCRWRDFIKKNEEEPPWRFHTVSVSQNESDGAEAETSAEPLLFGTFCGAPYTLVRYDIESGRTHQIRAQSAAHGFPLLGDSAYGGARNDGRGFFLHAFRMEFPHENPLSLPPALSLPPPEPFLKFLEKTSPRGSLETLKNAFRAFIMDSYGQPV